MKEPTADQLRIVQRNELAYAAYSMTAQEKRLLWLAMGRLTPDTVKFPTWEIPVVSVAEYLGIDKTHIYRDIKRIAVALAGRVAVIPEGEPCEKTGEQGYVTANFARVRYVPASKHSSGTAHIELHLREEIAPYLLELKGRFSSIEFTAISALSSFYAMRVYEILAAKRHETGQPKNLVTISVGDLRKMLELEKQYPNFKDFRLRVLEPAKAQINERTPMGMSFKELRARTRGAPVLAVEFLMWDKENHYGAQAIPAQMLMDWGSKTDDERLSEIYRIFEMYADPNVIRSIAGKYLARGVRSEVVIENLRNLRYAAGQIAANPYKVKNVVRYCVAAIVRNYARV